MYRFKVWNSDRIPREYSALIGCDIYGVSQYVDLEVSSYKEALKLKSKLKKFYLVGRCYNTSNPEHYITTLCWPR